MITLLIVFMLFVAVMQIIVFVETAVVVLPWTVTATLVAAILAVQFAKIQGRDSRHRASIAAIATFALTLALGFLGYAAIPPSAPSSPDARRAVLWGLPETTREEVRRMFPVHLSIWALGGASVSGIWCYRSGNDVSRTPRQKDRPNQEDMGHC